MMKLVEFIMVIIPYATFALIANVMGTAGFELVGSMAKYVLVFMVGLFVHVAVTYSSVLFFISRSNPLTFYKNMIPAIGTAFGSTSSAATLPVTKNCCEEHLNISKSVSSFVLPLSVTINMNGTSLGHGISTVFISQMYGIELGIIGYITIILVSLLASIGAPAIPGGGVVSLTMILLVLGIPFEGVAIAIVLGLHRLVDMFMTVVNVLGDAVCASYVNKSKKDSEFFDKGQLQDKGVVS